jgi:hypothetical protein
MPIIPALGGQRQVNYKFKDSLRYIERPYLKEKVHLFPQELGAIPSTLASFNFNKKIYVREKLFFLLWIHKPHCYFRAS